MNKQVTDTIAGHCGKKGFLDGPQGINLLSFPESLGIDEQGIVFFYDSGNKYIRMLDSDGYVYTMTKGFCREDIRYEPQKLGKHFTNYRVMCYKMWVKVIGLPNDYVFQDTFSSICTKH